MTSLRSLTVAAVALLTPTLVSASPVLTGITPRAWSISGLTDGRSNTILFGESTSLQLCVPNAAYPASVTDGTSNTIQFTETQGLRVRWTSRTSLISDGTSNTILLGESQCLNGIVSPDPLAAEPGTIPDGTSNTLLFGETPIDLRGRSFDVCFSTVRIASGVTDGTSNTIQFGETVPSRCYREVVIGSSLDVDVPAPGAAPLLGLALAGLAARRRWRR